MAQVSKTFRRVNICKARDQTQFQGMCSEHPRLHPHRQGCRHILTWSIHTHTVVKRALQHLFSLWRLKRFVIGHQIPKRIYSCTIARLYREWRGRPSSSLGLSSVPSRTFIPGMSEEGPENYSLWRGMIQNSSWPLCRSDLQLQKMFGWDYCCQRKVNQLLNPRVHILFPPYTVNVYMVCSIKTWKRINVY